MRGALNSPSRESRVPSLPLSKLPAAAVNQARLSLAVQTSQTALETHNARASHQRSLSSRGGAGKGKVCSLVRRCEAITRRHMEGDGEH